MNLVAITTRTHHRWIGICSGLLLGALLAVSPLSKAAETAQTNDQVERTYFTDTILEDQQGQKLRFYSDLLKGKTVVLHTFFGDCTGACPVMLHKMQKLQEALGDKLEREVRLISISVDPQNDTQERLAAIAAKMQARHGWYFLRAPREDVDRVLYKLGQYTAVREGHSTLFLIGNVPARVWKKVLIAAPESLLIDAVLKTAAEK